MNDEGNIVVETAASEPKVTSQPATTVEGTNIIINNESPSQPVDQMGTQINQPISETRGQDIQPSEPTIPLGEIPVEAPAPLVGAELNDLQVIEMMSQQARSSMYTQQELAKAGLESQLYTAIAYNESKNRAMAIDEYHIKRDKANKEAEHTGWYISPEDADMVTQMNMAKYMLQQPGITNAQRTKAQKTLATVQNYFANKKISFKGIETLDKIIKERSLDVLRAQNAVAAGEIKNMIAAQDLSIIQAIYSSLESGDTPEKIAAKFKGVMNQEDVYTIAESYYKAHGDSSMFYNKLDNLTDEEFKAYTKKVDGITYNDKEVYEYTYDNQTAYIYEDTITNAQGNKEVVYKSITDITKLADLKNLDKEIPGIKRDITKVYTKDEMIKLRDEAKAKVDKALKDYDRAFDKSERDKGDLYYWTLGRNIIARDVFNKKSKEYKAYQNAQKNLDKYNNYLKLYK